MLKINVGKYDKRYVNVNIKLKWAHDGHDAEHLGSGMLAKNSPKWGLSCYMQTVWNCRNRGVLDAM